MTVLTRVFIRKCTSTLPWLYCQGGRKTGFHCIQLGVSGALNRRLRSICLLGVQVAVEVACVASDCVWFWSKEDWGTGFSVLTAREMKRELKNEGRGRGRKQSLHWSFGFIEISPLTPSTRSKIQKINYFGFTHASSKVHFRSTKGQTFYWSIMTADDSINYRSLFQALR